MCQGVRDVANLIWKLARVLDGRSDETLLDSYEVERSRHVRELTTRIKAIGQVICERDPAAARERDARILAEGGGQPRTITRQEIVPPLAAGLLTARDDSAKGTLFPQPWVKTPEGPARLDTIAGAGLRLVLEPKLASELSPQVVQRAHALCLSLVAVSRDHEAPASAAAIDLAVEERDGVLAHWFATHGCRAALVRPDHYVFGTAGDGATLEALLDELQDRLAPLPAVSADPSAHHKGT